MTGATAVAEPVTADEPPRRRLPARGDTEVLLIWLVSRVATYVVAASGGWLFSTGTTVVPFLQRWQQWDAVHYIAIAQQGYLGSPTGVPLPAFFPGFPLALSALHAVGVGYVAAGLLVSLVASGVAAVALGRLADLELGPGGGRLAVGFLVTAPTAVFLAAGYTEALFLAFAVPAWLAVRRERWLLAVVLAAFAGGVRVTGVFLAAGLAVHYLVGDGGLRRRGAARLPLLAVPLLPVAAYFGYLHSLTGSWTTWFSAQRQGWSRQFTDPWDALVTTWNASVDPGQPAIWQWTWKAEVVAVALGVLTTVALLVWRRWGEAAYVGLTVVSLATSTWYFSVPRAALLWFPAFVGLAALARRPVWGRFVGCAWLALATPFAVLSVLVFTSGRWAG